MKILEPIVSRRSIRKYKTDPVDENKIIAMLESARLAPSGGNKQPWNFILVRSEELKQQIVAVSHHQSWMLNAPVFIVCVADVRTRLKEPDEMVLTDESPEPAVKKIIRDTSIAVEHLVLQAEAMGLATCWVAYFDQKDIRPILNIPSDKYVVAVISVGYADEHPQARPRRSLKEMIYYETWGNRERAIE
jgi:nitroreductase